MTIFAGRAHSIETPYALLGQAALRERNIRYRRLGLRLAGLLRLRGIEARKFAKELSARCGQKPSEESFYNRMADELNRGGLKLSDADLRYMAQAGRPVLPASERTRPTRRNWVAFLIAELAALFGGARMNEANRYTASAE